MRRAGRLAAAAALSATTISAWPGSVVHGESSPPIVETGWWSRDLLAQPVPDGGFAIGWAVESEQSAAALRVDLSGDLAGTVYLQLHEIGGAAPDLGAARLCITTDRWESANPGPYDALPETACAPGETADLGRDASSSVWVADITALVTEAETSTLSLVVRPVGKPVAAGLPATAPFQVQFDEASLLVDDRSGGPDASDGGDAVPVAPGVDVGDGAFADPGLSPSDFGPGFESPPLPDVAGSPPGATTPTTLGPTPDELVALGPIDATPAEGKPWIRILLLAPVSAAVGWAMAAARRWRQDRAIALGLG